MSKNKDIRSFFTVVTKKTSSDTSTNSKKRPNEIASDEVDTPKKRKIATSGDINKKRNNKEKSSEKENASLKQKQLAKSAQTPKIKKKIAFSSDEEEETLPKKAAQNTKKEKVVLSESDDEEESINNNIKKSTSKKIAFSSDEEELPIIINQVFKKQKIVFSDSDDEESMKKNTKKVTPKENKLVSKSAKDFFGNDNVKQKSKTTNQSNKQNDSEQRKSDDKFKATLKQLDTSKSESKICKDFDDTLLDLDNDFDADILNDTMNKAFAKDNTPKKSKKKNLNETSNNSNMYSDQEKFERKRQSSAMYQQYLNRAGPANHGLKELPEGKPDCLKNLCFLKTGVLDSMDRDDFEILIKKHGGRTVSAVSRKVNYLVVGLDSGPSKVHKAIEYGIKSISEDELLDLILTRSGQDPKYVKMANNADTDFNEKIKGLNKKPADNENTSKQTEKQAIKKQTLGISDIDVHVEWEPKAKQIKHDDIPEFTKISPKTESKPGTSRSIIKNIPIPKIYVNPPLFDEENMTFVDKYRPVVSSKIIGQQNNVDLLSKWLKNWSMNHIGKNKPKLNKPGFYVKNYNGAYFKCALLSGPPGVGKTTAAHLVAQELGFDIAEYNASDSRSKKMVQEQIKRQIQSKSIASFAKNGRAPTINHVLLMDEVDGMAGNEDRGGLQELISLIKITDIPIICMCNDRYSSKMRSLSNHCFDLKFAKPSNQQIKGTSMSICFRENIKIDASTIDNMIITAGNDVRQVLNHLNMFAAMQKNNKESTEEKNSEDYKLNKMDIELGIFDVIRKQLDYDVYTTMSLSERSRLFFQDYSMGPLFMQENYLHVKPHDYGQFKSKKEKATNHIQRIALASSAISIGDTIEKKIRSGNSWSLLQYQGFFAATLPSYYMHGHVGGISFPTWLAQNSRCGKFRRILNELRHHTRSSIPCSRMALNFDYVKPLRDSIVTALGHKHIDEAVNIMNTHNLLRLDLDNIVEFTDWKHLYNEFKNVATEVKTAFTKKFNKSSHMLPYAVVKVPLKKTRIASNENDYDNGSDSDDENDADGDDVAQSAMIKVKTRKVNKKDEKDKQDSSESKPKKAPAKGKTKPKASNKKK